MPRRIGFLRMLITVVFTSGFLSIVVLPFKVRITTAKMLKQRYGTQDHQGRQTGAVVHIVDKSQTQDRGTAPVGVSLINAPCSSLFFHKNTEQRNQMAEMDTRVTTKQNKHIRH